MRVRMGTLTETSATRLRVLMSNQGRSAASPSTNSLPSMVPWNVSSVKSNLILLSFGSKSHLFSDQLGQCTRVHTLDARYILNSYICYFIYFLCKNIFVKSASPHLGCGHILRTSCFIFSKYISMRPEFAYFHNRKICILDIS